MKTNRTHFIIFFFGLLLLGTGLGIAFYEGVFSSRVRLVLLLGLICFCYGPIRVLMFQRHLALSRRGRSMLIVLAASICVYAVINALAHRYPQRWDATRYQQHTLLPESVERIQELNTNVKLTAFVVGLPPKYLEDMFKEYERLSQGKIVTEIVDPLVQISYAAQFGSVIKGNERKLFVQAGAERKEIDFTDVPLSQEAIGNALMQVTRTARTACFLTGHGEAKLYGSEPEALGTFSKHLLANNIMGKELLLGMAETVPDSCDVLIIAGPKNHLTVKEERMIIDYLDRGGDALFLIENVIVTTEDNPLTEIQEKLYPSLNNILKWWGIKVEDNVVVDLASHASGDVGSPATRNYLPHRAIVRDLDYTFFIRPRSIKMLKGRRKDVNVAPLIMTASSEQSWGETNRYLKIKFDPEEDRAGPVPIAFAMMEAHEDGSISRLIAITDSDFLTNAYITAYSNAQLGINAVNWLTESDYKPFLDQKEVNVEKLDLTSQQKRMVLFYLLLGPGLIISIGMWIWMKRAYR